MHEEDYYETMMSDKEKARAFVDAQEWIFAKTMADIPHFFLFLAIRNMWLEIGLTP